MKGLQYFLLLPLLLSGCQLTEEEKQKIDKAASDLDKLANQIIITYPAQNATVTEPMMVVRADVPEAAEAAELALFVDGVEIARDSDGAPWEISWPAYYFGDAKEHSLLLKAYTKARNEIRSLNTTSIVVSAEVHKGLSFTEGLANTEVRDSNQLQISYTPLPVVSRYEITDGQNTYQSDSTAITLDNLAVGEHEFRYRALYDLSEDNTLVGPWSAAAALSIAPPSLPNIMDPLITEDNAGYNISISWESISDTDQYTIHFGESEDQLQTHLPQNHTNRVIIEGLSAGQYYWKLSRTNSLGQTGTSTIQTINAGVFKTVIGGTGYDLPKCLIKAGADDYLILAATASRDVTSQLQGSEDDWVILINSDGQVSDSYIENRPNRSRYSDILRTNNGDVYLAGVDHSSGQGVIQKLDSSLVKAWDSEILYRPQNISTTYRFLKIVNWEDSVTVLAEEVRTPSVSRYYLHSVNTLDGSISAPRQIPLPDLEIQRITSVLPRSNGSLTIVGYASPLPETNPEPWHVGAFAINIDSSGNSLSSWNNVRDEAHTDTGEAVELTDDRLAIFGRADRGGSIPGVALSIVNTNNSTGAQFVSPLNRALSTMTNPKGITTLGDNVLIFANNRGTLGVYRFDNNLIELDKHAVTNSSSMLGMNIVSSGDNAVLLYQKSDNIILQKLPIPALP